MKKFLNSLYKNSEISFEMSLLSYVLFMSAMFFISAIIVKCTLPFEEFDHQATIKDLETKLSTAQNEVEIAIINFSIQTENENWDKNVKATNDGFILFLGFSVGLPIFYIFGIVLSKISDKLFNAFLQWIHYQI